MSLRTLALGLLLACPYCVSAQTPAKPKLDAHGFPLPEGAIARIGNLHYAQPGSIATIAISPDGKKVASAGDGIYIWDAKTGRVTCQIPDKAWIKRLVFSKDGLFVAVATSEGCISICDSATGKEKMKGQRHKPDSDSELTGFAFIHDQKLLAVAQIDKVGPVQLWDVQKGTLSKTWAVDKSKLNQLEALGQDYRFTWAALSPSGEQMAWLATPPGNAKDQPCAVFIYETHSGRLLRELKELPVSAQQVSFCNEGEHLLLLGKCFDSTIEGSQVVVQAKSGKICFSFGYRQSLTIGRYAPLGSSLKSAGLTTSADGKSLYTQDELGMRCWELATGKLLNEPSEGWNCMAFAARGKHAVMAHGSRWEMCDENLKPVRPSTEFKQAPEIHYLKDGKLVMQNRFGAQLSVWSPTNGKIVESIHRSEAPYDGRTPCSYDAWGKRFVYHNEKGLVVRDLVDRHMCRLEIAEIDDVWKVFPKLSSDGTRVLVGTVKDDCVVVQWFDAQTGRELGLYRIPSKEIFPPWVWPVGWFSDNGTVFGYHASDNRLVLVDCNSKEICLKVGVAMPLPKQPKENRLTFPEWHFGRAAFDRYLTSSREVNGENTGHEYCIWDRATGQRARRFVLKPDGWENWSAVLSPDGRLMAVMTHYLEPGNEIRIYETATGTLRGTICAPCKIESFDFAPDGKTLATSCADTTVLIWDLHRPFAGGKATQPPPLNPAETEALWNSLGARDAMEMDRAFWALVRAPKQTVALLSQRLKPAQGPTSSQLQKWIANLDSKSFKERESATVELKQLGEQAFPAVQTTLLKKDISLEQRQRLEIILKHIENAGVDPAQLRELRAIEVLERIASSEALQLLKTLASRDDNSVLTREARAALTRLQATE